MHLPTGEEPNAPTLHRSWGDDNGVAFVRRRGSSCHLAAVATKRTGGGGTPTSLRRFGAKAPKNSRTTFRSRLTIPLQPVCPKASKRSGPYTRAMQNSMSGHHFCARLGSSLRYWRFFTSYCSSAPLSATIRRNMALPIWFTATAFLSYGGYYACPRAYPGVH